MNKVARYLNQHLVGNVFEKPEILRKYSTDRSIVKIEPKMVVVPENVNDVRRTVKLFSQLAAKKLRFSITPWGAGLDKTGADLGSGVVMDLSKLNHIQEIDERSRLVRVQAGITLEELNTALSLMGLTIPIKSAPGETIGSLISNFVSDSYGGKYNGIYYMVDCLEIVTATGDIIQTGRMSTGGLDKKKEQTAFEGAVYREISELIEKNFDHINDLKARPTVDSRGYQMITQVYRDKGKTFDLLPLLFGAQGTLGIITEVILRCEVLEPDVSRLAVAFPTMNGLMDFTKEATALEPLEINLYDARIFEATEETGKNPGLFSEKFGNGYILLISFNDATKRAEKKISRLLKKMPATSAAVVEGDENSTDFGRINGSLVSYLNDDLNSERAIIADDFYVPDEKLPEFLASLKEMEETFGTELALFGSFSTKNYNIRPEMNLSTVRGRQFAVSFLKDFTGLLSVYDGSITGGSPEGRVKAVVTNDELSDAEFELYQKVKEIFDPQGILNVEVKLGAENRDIVRNIRNNAI